MRLLVIAQAVDREDPMLGFFHRWLEEFAMHFERIEVVCLYEGIHELPDNIRVHSLGKEKGEKHRLLYALRFLSLAWKLRDRYDAVFVHMNQEYVLLAGWLWKLMRKPVYLWRNHYAGYWYTDIAALFCAKVFCTSQYSYTARYRKTTFMPVGIDTEQFYADEETRRVPGSILFLARMAPSKRPDILLHALAALAREGLSFTATFVGSPLPEDGPYYESLKGFVWQEGIADRVSFLPSIPHSETSDLYRTHALFVNCSPSGMLDKTIFEATACGTTVIAASNDWRELVGEYYWFDGTKEALARTLGVLLQSSSDLVPHNHIVDQNSLSALGKELKLLLEHG